MQNNFARMIQLVTEVFDVKNDPDQLDVDEHVRTRLLQIDAATLSEESNADGPIAWVLVLPTKEELMQQFIAGTISERALFDLTIPGEPYDVIYLCSASVLPEFRNKGIAQRLTLHAIESIKERHSIKALFFWPFSKEGGSLAKNISKLSGLPLYEKER